MPKTDPAEAMRQLRLKALGYSAKELGLASTPEFPRVYGVIMDWPIGKVTATVTSFATGDASLYTSSGFGIIGGIQHERVRMAARRLVSVAERHYKASSPTERFSHPADGKVRFVLLCYDGRRVIEGNIPASTGSGVVYELFDAGQAVLTELRQIAEASDH